MQVEQRTRSPANYSLSDRDVYQEGTGGEPIGLVDPATLTQLNATQHFADGSFPYHLYNLEVPDDLDVSNTIAPCLDLLNLVNTETNNNTDITDTDNIINSLAYNTLLKCKYYLPSQINFKSNNNFNILHCNARSIKYKFEQFLTLLASMACKFDIIGISETWLSDEIMGSYNMPDYNIIYNNRQEGRGGGVAIYIHKSFSYKERHEFEINNNLMPDRKVPK